MHVKMTGMGHHINKTINYLGTTKNGTVSHNTPKKRMYERAKRLFYKTGKSKYKQDMRLYKIYMRRDLRTFSNLGTTTKRGMKRKAKMILSRTNHKVQSINYELSPDPKIDSINPNDPQSINDFEDYVKTWINTNFNGTFTDTGKKSGKGYHKYKFNHRLNNQFYWFAVIQPDSRRNSHVHAHVIILNYDRRNGHAVDHNFYAGNHIRKSVDRATKKFNQSHNRQFTASVQRGQNSGIKPTESIGRIIEVINDGLAKTNITSRAKFKRYLNHRGVQLKIMRKSQHRKHMGLKFRLRRKGKKWRRWTTSSRLAKYQGGSTCTMKAIKTKLRKNLSTTMKARKARKTARKVYARANRKAQAQRSLNRREARIKSEAETKKPHSAIISDSLDMSLFQSKSAPVKSSNVSRSARSASAVSGSQEDYEPSMATSISSSTSSSVDTSALSASYMDSKASVAVYNHSMATLAYLNEIRSNTYREDASSYASYHSAFVEASNYSPNPALVAVLNSPSGNRNKWNSMVNKYQNRAKSSVSSVLHTLKAPIKQWYFRWHYEHIIPTKTIDADYFGRNKLGNMRFGVNKNDVSLMKSAEKPIINDLRRVKSYAKDEFKAGLDTISDYISKHNVKNRIKNFTYQTLYVDKYGNQHPETWEHSLFGLAKEYTHKFSRVPSHLRKFMNDWHKNRIAEKFDDLTNKIELRPNPVSKYDNAEITVSMSVSSASSQMSSAMSANNSLESVDERNISEVQRDPIESEKSWERDYKLNWTATGQLALSTPPSQASSVITSLANNSSAQSRIGYSVGTSLLSYKASSFSKLSSGITHHISQERGPEL